jgi:DNA-binding PadR family transcriptional regulator
MSLADGAEASVPDDLGSVCLLLLLHERPASGPELAERLRERGLAVLAEEAAQTLLALAPAGLVGDDADDRYALTPQAVEELALATDDLVGAQLVLQRFLARCGEHLAPVSTDVDQLAAERQAAA